MAPRRKRSVVVKENPDLFVPQLPVLTTAFPTPQAQGRPREVTPRRKRTVSGILERPKPWNALSEKASNELVPDTGRVTTPTLEPTHNKHTDTPRLRNNQFFEGLEINFGSMSRADANRAQQRLFQPCRVVVKDMFRQTFTNVPLHRILNQEEPAPSYAPSREGNLARNSPFMETTSSGGLLGRRRSMSLEVSANADCEANREELDTSCSTGTPTTAFEPCRKEKHGPSLEELMLDCLGMLKKCPAEVVGKGVLVKRAKPKKKRVAIDRGDVAMNQDSSLPETYAHEAQCFGVELACDMLHGSAEQTVTKLGRERQKLSRETQPMAPSIPTTVARSKEEGVAAKPKKKRVTRQSADVAMNELSLVEHAQEAQCLGTEVACDMVATGTQSMLTSIPTTVAPSKEGGVAAKPKKRRETRQPADVAMNELTSLVETYAQEAQCFGSQLACEVQRGSAKRTLRKLARQHQKLALETQPIPSIPTTVAPSKEDDMAAKPKRKRKKIEKPQTTETCEDIILELIPDWPEAATARKVAARSRQPRRKPGSLAVCPPAASDDQMVPESTEGKPPKKKGRKKAKVDHLLDDRADEERVQAEAIPQLLEQALDNIEAVKDPEPALPPSVPSFPCLGLENQDAELKDKKNKRRESSANLQTEGSVVEVIPIPSSKSAEPPSDPNLAGFSSKQSKKLPKRQEPPLLDVSEDNVKSEPRLDAKAITQAPPLPKRRVRLYSDDFESEPEANLAEYFPPPREQEPCDLALVSGAEAKHAKRVHRKKYMKIKKVKPSAAKGSREHRPPSRESAEILSCAVETRPDVESAALSQVTREDGRKCPEFPAEEQRAKRDPYLFQDTEKLLKEFTDRESEVAGKSDFQHSSVEKVTTTVSLQPFLATSGHEDLVTKFQLKELSVFLEPLTQVQVDNCTIARPGGCSPIIPATPLRVEQREDTWKPTMTETPADLEQVSKPGSSSPSSSERTSRPRSRKRHKLDKERKHRRRESHASSDPQQESCQSRAQSPKARKQQPPRAQEGTDKAKPEQTEKPAIKAQKPVRADRSRVGASEPSSAQAFVDGIVNGSSEPIPWRKFKIPKKKQAALKQIKELCLPEKPILDRLIPILGKTPDNQSESSQILSTPCVTPPPPPGQCGKLASPANSARVLTDSEPTCYNSSSTTLEELEPSERSAESATDSDRKTAALSLVTALALPNSAESQRLLSPIVSSYTSPPPQRRNVSARFTRSWAKNDSDESDEDDESDHIDEELVGEEDLPETFSEQVQRSEVAAGSEEKAQGKADKALDCKQEETDMLELHAEDCDLLGYGMEDLVSEVTSPNQESEEGTPVTSTTNGRDVESKTSQVAALKDRSTIVEPTAKPQDDSSPPRESTPTRSEASPPAPAVASTFSRTVACPRSRVPRPTASLPVLTDRNKPSGALPNVPRSCPVLQPPFSNALSYARVEVNHPAPAMKPLKQAGICLDELRKPGSCQRQNCIQHFGLGSPGLADCILREVSFWVESGDRDKFFHSEELVMDGGFGLPPERLQVLDVVEYRHKLIRIFGRRLLAERGLEALLQFFGTAFDMVVYQARFFNDILGSPTLWPLLRKDFDCFVLHFCRSEVVLNSASCGAVVSMATTHAKSMLRHCMLKAMKSVSGFHPSPFSLAVLITQAITDQTQLIETARLVRTVDSRTLKKLDRNTLRSFCRSLEQQGTNLPADLGQDLAFFKAIALNQNHPAASTRATITSPSGPRACATVRPQACRDPTLNPASSMQLWITDIPRTLHQQHQQLVAPPHNYVHFSPDKYLHKEQVPNATDRPVAVDPFFTSFVLAHSPSNVVAREASTLTPTIARRVLLPTPEGDRQAPRRPVTLPPTPPLPRTTTATTSAAAVVPKYIPTPKSQLPPPPKFEFAEEELWDSQPATSPLTEPKDTFIPSALSAAPRAPSEAQQISSWIAQRHFEPLVQLFREVPHNRLDQIGNSISLHYEEQIRQRAPDVARNFIALVDYLVPKGGPSAAGADSDQMARTLATVALTIFARFADKGIEFVDQAEVLLKKCCEERSWPASAMNCSIWPFGTHNACSMEMLIADCWLHGGDLIEAAEVLKEFWELGLGPKMAEHDSSREAETLVRLLHRLIEDGPKMSQQICVQAWIWLVDTFKARVVIPLELKEELPNLMDMAFATKHKETSLGIRGIWSKMKTKIEKEVEDADSVLEISPSDEESDRK